MHAKSVNEALKDILIPIDKDSKEFKKKYKKYVNSKKHIEDLFDEFFDDHPTFKWDYSYYKQIGELYLRFGEPEKVNKPEIKQFIEFFENKTHYIVYKFQKQWWGRSWVYEFRYVEKNNEGYAYKVEKELKKRKKLKWKKRFGLVNESIFEPLSKEKLHNTIFQKMAPKILPFEEVKIGMKVFPSFDDEDLRIIAKGTAEDVEEFTAKGGIDYEDLLSDYDDDYYDYNPDVDYDEDDEWKYNLPHVAVQINGDETFTTLYNPGGVYVLKNEQY